MTAGSLPERPRGENDTGQRARCASPDPFGYPALEKPTNLYSFASSLRYRQAPGVLIVFRLFQSIPSVLQVQLFNLRSRPGGPSQELQAGLDARVIIKASDINDLPHFLPPMMLHQPGKHHFQRDTVKRIFLLLIVHIQPIQFNAPAASFEGRKSGGGSHAMIRSRPVPGWRKLSSAE